MYNFIKSPLEGARLQNEGNHDAAKIEFRKLLDADPDNLDLLNQLVVSCIKTNEFEKHFFSKTDSFWRSN